MATLQIASKKTGATGTVDTHVAVQMPGDTLPTGHTAASTTAQLKDLSDAPVPDTSQTLFHLVQDALRQQLGPAAVAQGGLDMSKVQIDVTRVTGVSLAATATVAHGNTTQLTATVSPANASNRALIWTSSAPAKATVSASGLVTGVAAGTAVITVTSVDGGFSAACTVTIT